MPPEPARPTCDHAWREQDGTVYVCRTCGADWDDVIRDDLAWCMGNWQAAERENVQLRAALEAAIALGAHMDTCTRYLMGRQCDDCDVWTRALIEQARAALHAAAAPAAPGEPHA